MAEHAWLKTRLGWLHCQGNEAGVTRLAFADKPPPTFSRGGPCTRAPLQALERYFGGDLSALDGVPVALAGTQFQQTVWRELRKVRAGEFISYAELAERVGRPKGSRAVGQASAKNPVALFVPCHRVVTSTGSLGGYAWGAQRKAWLLDHERVSQLKPRTRRAKPEAPGPAPLPLFEKLDFALSLFR